MGRMYFAPFDGLAVTNDSSQDIWEITAGSANKVIIHGFEMTSAKTTAEIVALRLVRYATSGSVGGTAVEVPRDEDDAAVTAAVETLNTTPGGTPVVLMGWQWEQLGPLVYLPTPETRVVVQESGILALNLQTALAATTNWSGHLVWEEI